MHNQGVHIQSKTGSTIYSNSLAGFWTAPSIGVFDTIFDPRVAYDPFYDRWLATVLINALTTNSAVLVAVSVTSDPQPTNGWNFLRVKADTNSLLWADQPTLGFNKDWIVAQANMWPISPGGFEASYFFILNKTNMYSGSTNEQPVRLFHNDTDFAGNERPALTYDNSLNRLYLIQNADGNYNGTEGRLRLFCIDGDIDAPTLNYLDPTNAIYIKVQNMPGETVTWANNVSTNLTAWESCCSPQLGTNTTIGTASDARFDSVVYRNGSLWAAHTVFLPATNVSRSAIQWWQINPEAACVVQRGRVDDPTGVNFYAFGSLGVNRFNDVLIGLTWPYRYRPMTNGRTRWLSAVPKAPPMEPTFGQRAKAASRSMRVKLTAPPCGFNGRRLTMDKFSFPWPRPPIMARCSTTSWRFTRARA